MGAIATETGNSAAKPCSHDPKRRDNAHEQIDEDSLRRVEGMGANTAVVANALGLKVGLCSVIGTDADDYRKYLENLGVKLFLKGIFGDTTKSMFFNANGNEQRFNEREKIDNVINV